TTHYDYTVNGEHAKETFSATYRQDVLSSNVLVTTSTARNQSSVIGYDAQGRMAHVVSQSSSGDNIDSLDYRYDELGNRRELLARYSRPATAQATSDQWFTYDAEGNM